MYEELLKNYIVGVIGLLVLVRIACTLLYSVVCFALPGGSLKKLGKWSIVTGATDGIGKAIAEKLAKKGVNMVLISRTQSKLDDFSKELKEKHGIEVVTVSVDFSNFDKAARDRVAAAIDGKDIGILVNNVGMSYPFPKYFEELTEYEVGQMIGLNITSTSHMTHLVLPAMKQRKRGAILNIASAAAQLPNPLLTQYAASKRYVERFSESLAVELAPFNIKVQCQVPLYVTTKLSKIRRSSLMVPTPSQYAAVALAALSKLLNPITSTWFGLVSPGTIATVSPYWPHTVQLWAMATVIPSFVLDQMVTGMHLGIRKSGMRKMAAAKKD